MTSDSIPTQGPFRVLIADESEEALERLRSVLEESLGHRVVSTATSIAAAADAVEREDPDLSIVMVHNDDEHALDLISEMVEWASGPVIAHVGDGEETGGDFARRAAERGIDAYVGAGGEDEVQAAIEVALRRDRERRQLNEQVGELERAIERRGTIERAKGILMERHGIGEREAFELLRDHARAERRRVVAVAAAVAHGHALLPRGAGDTA